MRESTTLDFSSLGPSPEECRLTAAVARFHDEILRSYAIPVAILTAGGCDPVEITGPITLTFEPTDRVPWERRVPSDPEIAYEPQGEEKVVGGG